jgi:hypothetical protein
MEYIVKGDDNILTRSGHEIATSSPVVKLRERFDELSSAANKVSDSAVATISFGVAFGVLILIIKIISFLLSLFF